jgi:predicted nucleic-acid-binding protein
MKIIADTNVLLRYVLGDDPVQYKRAVEAMEKAEAVVVTNQALCELVWVLRSHYGVSRANIATIIAQLGETEHVVVDSHALGAGLTAVQAGGDLADGVIAYEGAWLGGETFVSFDEKAAAALGKQGLKVKLLA